MDRQTSPWLAHDHDRPRRQRHRRSQRHEVHEGHGEHGAHGAHGYGQGQGHACKEPPSKRRRVSQIHDNVAQGKSSQPSSQHIDNDFVENWLATTGTPAISPPPRDSARTQQRHRSRAVSNTRTHHRADDATWQPHRPSVAINARSTLLSDRDRKHARRTSLDDSSLLSESGSRRTPFEAPSPPFRRECLQDETSSGDRRRKVDTTVEDFSSRTSRAHASPCFEKRPRRKTRDDRYDTKKQEHKNDEPDGRRHHHRSKKSKRVDRREAMKSNRNVMKNFKPKAVLNDRITVRLTRNPRTVIKTDSSHRCNRLLSLASSRTAVSLLINQDRKRDPMPKPLSQRRLRELERRNREIEEVSAFFLPPNAHDKVEDSDCLDQRRIDKLKGSQAHHGRQLPSTPGRVSFPSSASGLANDTTTATARRMSLSFPLHEQVNHIPRSLSLRMPSPRRETSKASKATSYFTWSASPPMSPNLVEPQPSPKAHRNESSRSPTPEYIRKALIETGIYRNTGIKPYDDVISPLPEAIHNDPIHRNSIGRHSPQASRPPRSLNPKSKVQYQNEVAMTEDHLYSLLTRWHDILPPEWRIKQNDSREANLSAAAPQRGAQRAAPAMSEHQSLPQLRISSHGNSVEHGSDPSLNRAKSKNVIEMAQAHTQLESGTNSLMLGHMSGTTATDLPDVGAGHGAQSGTINHQEHEMPQDGDESCPSQQTLHTGRPMNRQNIAQEARLHFLQNGASRPSPFTPRAAYMEGPNNTPSHGPRQVLEKPEYSQIPSSLGDSASITSRDLMPPPPLPNKLYVYKSNQPHVQTEVPQSRANSVAGLVDIPEDGALNGDFDMEIVSQESLLAARDASTNSRTGSHSTVSPLQSVSWITPTQTPPTPSVGRGAHISRASTRTPFYPTQMNDVPSEATHEKSRQASSELPQESMADFIARIEHEAYMHTSEEPFDDVEPSFVPADSDVIVDKDEPLDLNDAMPPEQQCEYTEPRSLRFASQVYGQEDSFEREISEMFEFWRPNHFSQF